VQLQCYVARRSAKVVKAMVFLTEQAGFNERRRRRLADLAQEAENAWRAGNPKAGPPEKELFMKKWRGPKRKTRKWKLVPIITFCDT
jgi:hypothetical protein